MRTFVMKEIGRAGFRGKPVPRPGPDDAVDANMTKIPDGVQDGMTAYCCDMLPAGFMGAAQGDTPIGGTVGR